MQLATGARIGWAILILAAGCGEPPPPEPVRPVVSMVVQGEGSFENRW